MFGGNVRAKPVSQAGCVFGAPLTFTLPIMNFLRLILLLFAISVSGTVHSESQPKPEPNQQNNPPSNEQHGTDQNPISIKILPSPQSKAEATTQENHRKEKAEEDRWLVNSTIWLAVVTTFLALFTAALWWATRKLVIDAKETSKRKLRSYVSVVATGRIPNAVNPILPAFQIKIRNTGQTPAYGVRSWRGIGIHELPLVTELKPMGAVTDADLVIGSQCESVLPVRRVTPFATEQINGVKTGTHALYVFGRVEYRDVFGDRHFTDFCLCETDGGPDAGLKHAPSGNNAD